MTDWVGGSTQNVSLPKNVFFAQRERVKYLVVCYLPNAKNITIRRAKSSGNIEELDIIWQLIFTKNKQMQLFA